MAGKYKREELKEMLHHSAFHIVANDGIEGLTVRKVVKGCGLSDPYIYRCYSDLDDLMRTAFLEIDEEIARILQQKMEKCQIDSPEKIEKSCDLLWNAYWQFLLEDPDKTNFYWRFYQSGYFDQEIQEERRKCFRSFVEFVQKVAEKIHLNQPADRLTTVLYIKDSTLSIAVKINQGWVKREDVSKEAVYGSVFSYFMHLMGMDIWQVIRQKA